MKTTKRLIALTIVTFMTISSLLCGNVFAAEEPRVFTDVSDEHEYSTAIYALTEEGVIDGVAKEDGTYEFKPNDTITRAEVAKLIAVSIAENDALLIETTTKFPDVPVDHWSNKYVAP